MKEILREEYEEEHGFSIGRGMQDGELPTATALGAGFSRWVERLRDQAVFANGVVFVCDSAGIALRFHAFSAEDELELKSLLLPDGEVFGMGKSAVSQALVSKRGEMVCGEEHECALLRKWNSYAVNVCDANGGIVAWIGLLDRFGQDPAASFRLIKASAAAFRECLAVIGEQAENAELRKKLARYGADTKNRGLIYEVSKRLHSKIDVDSVLSEILELFKEESPHAQIDIFLSQDNRGTEVSVKPIIFNHHSKDIRNLAYIQGKPVVERDADRGRAVLAVPLSGKQGVYGVLQIQDSAEEIDRKDMGFLSMLADTAGMAFENARLYEHSNALINELRLINEITKRLNQSLKLKDVFNFASSKLLSIFGAEYSCILQVNNEAKTMSVQATNFPGMANDEFDLDYGFSGMIYHTKEPVIVSDYRAQKQIRSKLMDCTEARSLIASPILINHAVAGIVMVAHRKAGFFSYENYKLLQVLSDHIGLAISNASLHSKVRKMAITDRLTGLYARHYLDEQINLMQRKDFCGSLIVLDIDNFKKINDTFGHQVGDQVLMQVSRVVDTSIRDTDIAARWGGEELAVYLAQTTVEHTLHVAERIRSRIESETSPGVTISCGISDWNWEDDKISVEHLFYKADMALYEAKNNGKNRIQVVGR